MRTRQTRWRRLAPALTVAFVIAVVGGVVAVALLNGVGLASARPAPASIWQTLAAKPLRLSRLARGQSCAATPVRQSLSPDYTVSVGAGPVYVVGGAPSGVVTYIPPSLFNSGLNESGQAALGGVKVRWQIAPSYHGAVLIRGSQLDGPNRLAFNGGMDQPEGNALDTRPVLSQLRLMGAAANAPGWSTWVTLTRLSHPGCYAYQVDGVSFSYTITFQAVSELG